MEGTTSIFAPNRNCYLKSVVTGSGTLQWNIPYLREHIQGNFSGFTGRIIANGVSTDKNGSLFLMSSNKNIANAVVEAFKELYRQGSYGDALYGDMGIENM